jgi:hypothetical protein
VLSKFLFAFKRIRKIGYKSYKTKNASLLGSINNFAERMGFEPTMQLPTY